MRISKRLIRHEIRDKLLQVNARECDLLRDGWLSEERMSAIMKFLSRKK